MRTQYEYTSQKALRRAFREQFPELDFRTIKDYSGKGRMYKTNTRCAFVDWIDYLQKDGQISRALANRATL